MRKSFQEKMNLMIQHDQLRKELQHRRKAREAERVVEQTRVEGGGGGEIDGMSSAGGGRGRRDDIDVMNNADIDVMNNAGGRRNSEDPSSDGGSGSGGHWHNLV